MWHWTPARDYCVVPYHIAARHIPSLLVPTVARHRSPAGRRRLPQPYTANRGRMNVRISFSLEPIRVTHNYLNKKRFCSLN